MNSRVYFQRQLYKLIEFSRRQNQQDCLAKAPLNKVYQLTKRLTSDAQTLQLSQLPTHSAESYTVTR